ENYCRFADQFVIPAKPDNELRPYITSKSIRRGKLPFDFRGAFEQAPVTGEEEDVLKQHLLYCHSVAIHDPLPYYLDCVETSYRWEWIKAKITNYLAFLCQVQPLLREGILWLVDDVPFRGGYHGDPERPRPGADRCLYRLYSGLP